LIITVDTEGDNLWARPRTPTTRNAEYLGRFQRLCETYGFRPTYLTNWEMVNSPVFQELGQDALRRQQAEIGMHLHAWDSPPLVPLTADDARYHPYLTEYPEALMREKVRVMTAALEDVFGVKMLSHRGGRWGFDEVYARILVEFGYHVDCSVTPHVSWRDNPGDPARSGGPDYTNFPESCYFLDLHDIRHQGDSTLLEVPLTAVRRPYSRPVHHLRVLLKTTRFGRRVSNRLFPDIAQMYPVPRNHSAMLWLLATARRHAWSYVELALHSSELMPGGNPTFALPSDIERLYARLEALFAAAHGGFEPRTLSQFYADVSGRSEALARPRSPA
jgi:hypothetical protein